MKTGAVVRAAIEAVRGAVREAVKGAATGLMTRGDGGHDIKYDNSYLLSGHLEECAFLLNLFFPEVGSAHSYSYNPLSHA